ncbi:MAG: toxin-activating lysine-acyltransferase [Pseudomonadota bacterium]|uniref:toxin-activating lysine-acyltransferase n=1 Tax=Polaromonas sp. TaxID=1869339 RepID=UPI0017C0B6E9|nr:toxin-activating lysine-acyltransferase [Polaromonas sp.]MBA3593855.1 toxin-activating lysine-acyltransferase [Polaromonas sp.]MDQ3272845.1 toxin-activating lysine-acyltransferase [Pseudomonadota bacterium]
MNFKASKTPCKIVWNWERENKNEHDHTSGKRNRSEQRLAFASWARFSDATAQRYRLPPHQLMTTDWASGDQIWLIDVFTPFGGAQDVLKDLRDKIFAGQTVYQLVPVPGAPPKVLAWPAIQSKPDTPTSSSQHPSHDSP